MSTQESTLRPEPRGNWIISLFVAALVALGIYFAFFYGVKTAAAPTPEEYLDNVGQQQHSQAPRGEEPMQQQPAPDGVYNTQAEADAAQQQAIQEGEQRAQAAPAVELGPLPVNSAGEPVIDARQQQQLDQSANMAAAEAAQAQLDAQRAEAAVRPPDVSYEDAQSVLVGRDPCSIRGADPATCKGGWWKPTPVQESK